ncbi:ccr4 associated factor [Orbilia ellipsospora]|uniref:Iron-sulfur cluster assembly factor IBA57 homolog, mitochondrial n=1 Tax=Orbilia ellipsospora TaxID=2528407 RepID=A0AAV9X1W2_9PEZI
MSRRTISSRFNYICRSCLQKRSISTSPSLHDAVPTQQKAALPSAPPAETRTFKLSESRKLISIQGLDATKFLNGITTNILPDSKSVEGLYSAFLTAQGRVLYDVFIYPTNHTRNPSLTNGTDEPAFLIDVAASLAPELVKHIRRYKLRSKFAVKQLDGFTVWSVPNSFRLSDDDVNSSLRIGCVDPRAPGMGRRIVLPDDYHHTYTSPGEEGAGEEGEDEVSYRLKRYLAGVPETPGEIVVGSGLPQESNVDYMSGINFHKGCYVGQELTIRTRHTGVVRKRILPVQLYTGSGDEVKGASAPVYDAAFGGILPDIPAGANIARVNKKARSAGKFLGNVGNVGLALCRLEIMTGLNLGGEGASFDAEVDEFKVEMPVGEEEIVKIRAFVPEWHTTGNITNEAL